MDNNIKNIILFGETGTGKSSVINMILNREAAPVSDAAIGCTFEFNWYPNYGHKYFDTVGLSEGSRGMVTSTKAVSALINLLKSMMSGVNLLVFVIKKDRIKKTLEDNYKLFVDIICMSEVPVILVVTHCDKKSDIEQWWKNNKKYFDSYGMHFKDCVCVCATKGDDDDPEMSAIYKQRYEASREPLVKCIENNIMEIGWKMKMDCKAFMWKKICNIFCKYFSWPHIPYLPDLVELIIKIGFEKQQAIKIANDVVDASDPA